MKIWPRIFDTMSTIHIKLSMIIMVAVIIQIHVCIIWSCFPSVFDTDVDIIVVTIAIVRLSLISQQLAIIISSSVMMMIVLL